MGSRTGLSSSRYQIRGNKHCDEKSESPSKTKFRGPRVATASTASTRPNLIEKNLSPKNKKDERMNQTIDCSQEKRLSLERSLKKKKMNMIDDLKRISEAREFQQSRISQ